MEPVVKFVHVPSLNCDSTRLTPLPTPRVPLSRRNSDRPPKKLPPNSGGRLVWFSSGGRHHSNSIESERAAFRDHRSPTANRSAPATGAALSRRTSSATPSAAASPSGSATHGGGSPVSYRSSAPHPKGGGVGGGRARISTPSAASELPAARSGDSGVVGGGGLRATIEGEPQAAAPGAEAAAATGAEERERGTFAATYPMVIPSSLSSSPPPRATASLSFSSTWNGGARPASGTAAAGRREGGSPLRTGYSVAGAGEAGLAGEERPVSFSGARERGNFRFDSAQASDDFSVLFISVPSRLGPGRFGVGAAQSVGCAGCCCCAAPCSVVVCNVARWKKARVDGWTRLLYTFNARLLVFCLQSVLCGGCTMRVLRYRGVHNVRSADRESSTCGCRGLC